MGLTIHYRLRLKSPSRNVARAKVQGLHDFAKALPFADVSNLVSFAGKEADFNNSNRQDQFRWLKVQAMGNFFKNGALIPVQPAEIIAFFAWPGEGCEPANFGLCRYPATIEREGTTLSTRMGSGWHWSSFCKTQYASNLNAAHCLRSHIMIVKMLDKAKELGFVADCSDEGGYWENRNVAQLAETIGEWNTLLAGTVGELKDLLDGQGLSIQAPITERGDFEHLEAKARNTKGCR